MRCFIFRVRIVLTILTAFCGYACFYLTPALVAYESLAHEALPIVFMTIASVGLIIRLILHKRQRQRRINQRRMTKMTLQLISISVLYFCTNFPYTINPIAYFVFGLKPIGEDIQGIFLNYVSIFLPILLPYLCLTFIPSLRQKLLFFCRVRRARIVPIEVT